MHHRLLNFMMNIYLHWALKQVKGDSPAERQGDNSAKRQGDVFAIFATLSPMNNLSPLLTRYLYMLAGIVLLVITADFVFKLLCFILGLFLLIRGLTYNSGGVSSMIYTVRSRFFDRF